MSDIYKCIIDCPNCGNNHIDVGEWASREHHKHLCHYCHEVFEILPRPTAGVLPNNERAPLIQEYALGFDSGCRYSKIEIDKLKADIVRLETENLETVTMFREIIRKNDFLVKDINEFMNGENAAIQSRLCDIIDELKDHITRSKSVLNGGG